MKRHVVIFWRQFVFLTLVVAATLILLGRYVGDDMLANIGLWFTLPAIGWVLLPLWRLRRPGRKIL